MNQFIQNIINYGVKLIVQALTFIPNLTADAFNAAIDLAIEQLTAAKATFTVTTGEVVATKVEEMVYNGLEVAQNACDAAGDTKLDAYFTIAESVDQQIESGSFNIFSALSAWIKAKKVKA